MSSYPLSPSLPLSRTTPRPCCPRAAEENSTRRHHIWERRRQWESDEGVPSVSWCKDLSPCPHTGWKDLSSRLVVHRGLCPYLGSSHHPVWHTSNVRYWRCTVGGSSSRQLHTGAQTCRWESDAEVPTTPRGTDLKVASSRPEVHQVLSRFLGSSLPPASHTSSVPCWRNTVGGSSSRRSHTGERKARWAEE